jgi:YrbI family 3-deoxy-D-manno-octulosonate 8-phosphate phosphatase
VVDSISIQRKGSPVGCPCGGNLPEQVSVVAVILALGAVDDLLRPLGGHPLITYSVAAALQTAPVSHMLVVGDPRLVDGVRQYVHSYRNKQIGVDRLTVPPDAHLDQVALSQTLNHWNSHQTGPQMELAIILQSGWPLYPRGALEDAVRLLWHNPQAAQAVSLVPTSLTNRWWAHGGSGTLVPLSLALAQSGSASSAAQQGDGQLYVETGHFRIMRLDKQTPSSITLPVVLDPQYGVNAAGPAERQWAEWQVQFGNLDMVYPGWHPRPFPVKVALLVMDFDGVLTDNRVWVDEEGHEHIAANRSDSLGLAFLRRAGVEALVISMETNPVVSARCRKMKVPVLQGINDKAVVLKQYLAEKSIDPDQVVYLGNDVNDLVCFPLVGCAVAVSDSLPTVLRQADLVLANRGGHAAVRELCDLILLRAGN